MLRRAVLLGTALALAACSQSSQEGPSSNAISGSDGFVELVEDARVAVRAGNLQEAAGYYDEALALEPDSPALWVDIARLRFRGGEHLIAIEAADRALELDPQFAPALLMRAQLVRDAHGLAEALPWFEAAAIADPRNPEVLADYAATLGDQGRYKDMLRVVRELAEIDPAYPQVHYLQAVLAARAENPVLAGSLLNRSGLIEAGVPAALMLDAVIDMQQGSFDTAAETLESLAARQPGNMRVDELLARAQWLGGRDRALVNRFSAQAESEEASPYLTMLVGRALERMGERERAIPFIERALAPRDGAVIALDNSNSLPAATAELREFVQAERSAQAVRFSRRLIERSPYSADLHALAGDAAMASRDYRGALELYEISARTRRSWGMTRKMIHAFDALGDPLTSEVLLTRAIAGDPHNTEALLLLAERSALREDWLRTALLLDNAIALGAGNDLEVLELRALAAQALGREEEAARFRILLEELSPADFL